MRTLLLLLTAITLLSCKKEVPRPATIQFGNDSGMMIRYRNLIVDGNIIAPKSKYVDIDNDGTFDLHLYSGERMPDLQGLVPEAYIESLHSGCKILVDKVADSIFVHSTTQFNTTPNNEPMVIETVTYSCKQEVSFSTFYNMEESFVITPKTKLDYISRDDIYKSQVVYFAEPDEAVFEPTGVVDQGVVYYSYVKRKKRCRSYPQNIFRYIGLKMSTPEGTKLGWIKLKVHSYNYITVNSWAIQN